MSIWQNNQNPVLKIQKQGTNMIKLHQFPPCWNLPNASPFCMKLETFLKMTNLPYQVVNVMDPRKAPKGKLPFIEENGKKIADSGIIIDYLKLKYGDLIDVNLSPLQKAQSVALQRLFEDHLYWIIVYSRWSITENWEITKRDFFKKLPKFLKLFLPNIIRKKTLSDLYAQGLGRHTPEEVFKMGIDDLESVAIMLGNNDFFMGNEPSSIDACAFGFLANIVWSPIVSPLQDYIKAKQNLVDYCDRMQKRFYK